MQKLNNMVETALKIILDTYDGNTEFSVKGKYELFPEYMHLSLGDVFDELKTYGYITFSKLPIASWSIYLTPDGLSYFQNKEEQEKEKNAPIPNSVTNIFYGDVSNSQIQQNASASLQSMINNENRGGKKKANTRFKVIRKFIFGVAVSVTAAIIVYLIMHFIG
jgi:hypothetical protein